ILEIAGTGSTSRKIFLSHGNRYGVERDLNVIADAARNAGAEAALYGHTHVPNCTMQDGIFLLNPGSIGRPRSSAGPSFAVLECSSGEPLSARFFCLARRAREMVVQELKLK
ncbi:MAG: metallophosphoesterase family protein, partial [Treponema sp.]|nr:metallophosphoesterase family protein [Treponema sp.]